MSAPWKRPQDQYMRQASYDNTSSPSSSSSRLPQQTRAAAPANGGSMPPPLQHGYHAGAFEDVTNKPRLRNTARAQQAQRRQTVRGARPGTVREPGIDARKTNYVAQRALTRGKTLTRPDRFVAPAPLINPGNLQTTLARRSRVDLWGFAVNVLTFWAPRWLLTNFGLTDRHKQRAWKEKCALCTIALLLMGVIGFLTLGMTRVLCPTTDGRRPSDYVRLGEIEGFVGIEGWNFNVSTTTPPAFRAVSSTLSGTDVSYVFGRAASDFPACAGIQANYATANLCHSASGTTCAYGEPSEALFASLGLRNTSSQVGYDWDQLRKLANYFILDGNVLNLTPYVLENPTPVQGDLVDSAIRYVLHTLDDRGGKDATRLFYNSAKLKAAVPCLVQRYYAGHIDKTTPGCFISQLYLYVSLSLILGIVFARFFMALVFKWFLSKRLVEKPRNLKRNVISPAVMPEGANVDVNNQTGAAPWTNNSQMKRQQTMKLQRSRTPNGAAKEQGIREKNAKQPNNEFIGADGMINAAAIGAELFTACLVTCYSEGEDSLRTTLDSIAGTDYSDARKLLFVVCDGMVSGSGEKRMTPDICVSLLTRDSRFGEPMPMSYLSVGAGSQAHNQALVYAGHYTNVKGHRTPTVIVVKCGTPDEAKDPKPGNRGKRDSQMILMNFFSRVTYNDRMTPLDFDLFRKIQALMGVTPDFFECVLMVDADTKVYPNSLKALVRCLQNDPLIMGVCGETRIANKRQSFITMIQVFEYFISHWLAKAFESVFGGVSCLPGCFSAYRLKVRKDGDSDWFPVLVSPTVIAEYSQSVVTTLHQKNLLLLGEDRFLTTMLLRTFPNRKMMFCPQARCRTVVPDTFRVLLSQRRRWINSTVHNLMELLLVRDLCGTFCFSMSFVVFIDLIGTVVLPIAICLTYTLLILYCFNPPSNFADAIPLMLLFAVLGLPAVLIAITTFKIVYIGWMLLYIIALPIWNCILPLYAFTKFDDFSWGETRRVEGEKRGADAHSGAGVAAAVPLRRWEDWERSRLRKGKRERQRRRDLEKTFGTRGFHNDSRHTSTYEDSPSPSETASMFSSSDDDRWGAHLGQYAEESWDLPPPVGLYMVDSDDEEHERIEASEMELVLEGGWADDDDDWGSTPTPLHHSRSSPVQSQAPTPPVMYSLRDTPAVPSNLSASPEQRLNLSFSSFESSPSSPVENPFSNASATLPLMGGAPSSSYYYSNASTQQQQQQQQPPHISSTSAAATAVDRSPSNTRQHVKRRSLSNSYGSGSGHQANPFDSTSPLNVNDSPTSSRQQHHTLYHYGPGGDGAPRRLI